jgi:hypothetical protein
MSSFTRGGRKSGGRVVEPPEPHRQPAAQPEAATYQTVPPEEQRETPPHGLPRPRRVILVHDERGQVVSVTKVAPDAKFGVGVKPNPGHTVKELEAGDLPEDPFGD